MRALAKSLSVKAPSLYRYYPDKTSLERDAVEFGNRLLLGSLQRATRAAAREDLYLAAGEAYRRFAKSKPHLYSLMMEKRLVYPPTSESGKMLWEFVLAMVRQASGDMNETARAVALWSFMHGFVTLEQAGRFGASGPMDGFALGVRALSAGFKIQQDNPA